MNNFDELRKCFKCKVDLGLTDEWLEAVEEQCEGDEPGAFLCEVCEQEFLNFIVLKGSPLKARVVGTSETDFN